MDCTGIKAIIIIYDDAENAAVHVMPDSARACPVFVSQVATVSD